MAESETVTSLPRPLPSSVPIDPGMGLSPNEMRALKDLTGRTLTDLIGGDLEDMDTYPDRTQALIWVQLHRMGYSPTWDQAGDVRPQMRAASTAPDPTTGAN